MPEVRQDILERDWSGKSHENAWDRRQLCLDPRSQKESPEGRSECGWNLPMPGLFEVV